MAHITGSKWYKPPSLKYKSTAKERRRQAEEYKRWLANQKLMTPREVDIYIEKQKTTSQA